MDSIEQLLHLRLSIKEYVHQFGELSDQVPLYDEILFKDLFHFGLNEPIKSLHKYFFPGGEFKGSLSLFMDYALQLSDSLFPMGATEEDRDAVLPRERMPAPEHSHKMAEAKTYHQLPESLNRPAKPESAHVRPAKPGPARVMSAPPESPAKMATTPADTPLWPGPITSVLDLPLVSV